MSDTNPAPITEPKALNFFKDLSNLRSDLGDERELMLLGESLRVRQLMPVIAMADGTLIAGFRRIAAARLVGLKSLMATIYAGPLGPDEILAIQFTENFHRLEMSAFDRWKAMDDMLKANPSWGPKELCQCLKLDPSAVTKYLSPSKCSPDWREALRNSQVGITDCYTASQVPESEQVRLLQMKLAGASREVLNRTVRKSKVASDETVARSSRVTIPLASGTKVIISGKRHSMAEIVDSLTECLSVVRDGIKRRLDVKLFQDALKLESGTVGGHDNAPG